MKRCSVQTWNKNAMQAAGMRVGVCEDHNYVGIDMVAQDGNAFAHGHFDVATAMVFRQELDDAITEALKEHGSQQ